MNLSFIIALVICVLIAIPLRTLLQGLTYGELYQGKDFAKQYGPWGIVVGASRGLGSAWAHGLAQRGLNVIITGRVQKTLDETLHELKTAYPDRQFVTVVFDATDRAKADEICAKLAQEYEIGMVVTNAIMTPMPQPFLDAEMEDVDKSISLNVFGIVHMVRIFGTEMRKRKRGGFVLVSSVAGSLGLTNMAMYSSTKAFATMLGQVLWNEGKKDNIDYITPVVGQTATPSLDDFLNPKHRVLFLETTPQNVVRETMFGLGRAPYVYTGWSTKVQSFVYWLVPQEITVQILALLMKDFFKSGDELKESFNAAKSGRQSRS